MKLNIRMLVFVVSTVTALSFPLGTRAAPNTPPAPEDGSDAPFNTSTCQYVSNGKPYGYCITRTQGSTNPDILYYMHGAGSYERGWVVSRRPIWQYWHDQGLQAPTVVTFSFGPIWLLAEKNKAKASGLFGFFVNTLMPRVEAELGGLKGRRLLVGESMGGYNASQLVLKRPDLFARAAILCPDIASLTPYASQPNINAYMSETGADPKHTYWEMVMDRIFYPDDDTWNRSAPLILGQTALGPRTPPLYISCGSHDQYGFFPGDQSFAALALSKGVPMIWDPSDGKHCSYNAETVAKFLLSHDEGNP